MRRTAGGASDLGASPPSTHGTGNKEGPGVLGHGGSPQQMLKENGGPGEAWMAGPLVGMTPLWSGRTRGRTAEREASRDSFVNCASRCQDNSEKFSISNIVVNLDRRRSPTEEGAWVKPLYNQSDWLYWLYWDKPTSGRVFCSGLTWTCDTYVTCWQVSQVC